MAKDFFENYIKNVSSKSNLRANDSTNTYKKEKESYKTDVNQEINVENNITKYIADSIETITKSIVDGINLKINTSVSDLKNPEINAFNDTSIYDIAISNGNVIIPGIGVFVANLGIINGKIATITNAKINGRQNLDALGKYVSPGIIDPHIHLGLFAPFEKEIETETKAAIAGGVTTVGCFIGSPDSHFNTFPEIEDKIEKLSNTDIIPHLIINNDTQKREIKDYIDYLGVTSFKLYMNGIPDIVPDVDDGFILDVFDEIKKANKRCMICVHAENRDLVKRATFKIKSELEDKATIRDWDKTHPEIAEEEAVIRLSYLAKKMGVNVYMVHISSADAVKRLRKMKPENKYINVETTSPYLTINNKSMDSNIIKMEPPFRNLEDIEELWAGIEDDTIDTIGTDNVTMTKSEKNMQDESIWNVIPGYPAVETHLPVLLNEGVIRRRIPIEKIIEKLTKKPAEIFGIYPQKGSMMVGSDADITIIDLNEIKEVKVENLNSRSDFSLYEGKKLQGWPVMTIKSGKIVYEGGKFTNEKVQCEYLKR